MKKFLFLFTILLIIPISSQSFITKAYCASLGNTDVKQEYKVLVHQALKDFGIKQPDQVPVKKMNRVGSIIALMPVSSFTAFGIWLDEKYLDSCSEEQRIFQIYHEAAHYAYKHHQKLLAVGAGIPAAAIAGLMYLHKKLNEQHDPHCTAKTVGVVALAAATIYLGILPKFIQGQEKQADLEAAKKLRELNKAAIIESHLQNLDKSNVNNHLWWHSESEQIQYLTNHY